MGAKKQGQDESPEENSSQDEQATVETNKIERLSSNDDPVHGDIDALSMIQQMDGLEDDLKNFLRVIFNHELDQGENAVFQYMSTYRTVVEAVISRRQGEGDSNAVR